MATLSNSPGETTTLRLEARKSFALGLRFYDLLDRTINITGDTLTLTVSKIRPRTSQIGDVVITKVADLYDSGEGKAVFNLQADELDLTAAEYYFDITMVHEDYSAVVLKGVVEIVDNTNFTIGTDYTSQDPAVELDVKLGTNVIHIHGPVIPPGPEGPPGPRGLRGLPGARVAPTDTVMSSYMAEDTTQTAQATDDRIDHRVSKGLPEGTAPLDVDARVPQENLPEHLSPSALTASFGPLVFLGSWDASANDPALSDDTGTTSTFYEVSAAGVVNLGSGDITFNAGDFVSYDGEVWTRTANTTPTNVIEAAENDLRLVRGTIDTNGSGTILEGGGFSITRNNIGDVTVTFTDAFSDVPSVTLTPLGGGSALGPIASHKNGFTRTPAAFRVEIVSIGAGFADGVFDFIAVGPQ